MSLPTIAQCKAWHATRTQRNPWSATQFTSVQVPDDNPAPAAAPIPARRELVLDPVKLAEAYASIEHIKQVAEESRRIGAESWARNRRNKRG